MSSSSMICASSAPVNPVVPFAALPHEIVADPRLTPVDVRVLAALLYWARDKAACWPCDRSIGSRVGRSVPVVQRSLRRLQGLGLIGREKVEPSDANRTGRVIRLLWRRRSAPRSCAITPPRSCAIDEGENERERERPIGDASPDGSPPSAGDMGLWATWASGSNETLARIGRAALAEAGIPASSTEAPLPCPARDEAPDPPVAAEIPEEMAAVSRPAPAEATPATPPARIPASPRPVISPPAQVPARVAPMTRRPPAPQRRGVGGVYSLGEVFAWPLNRLVAGPPHPRVNASP